MLVCVNEGQHDFKPVGALFETPWILPSNLTFKWDFSFTESCLYDYGTDEYLRDAWNKGGGVSMSLVKNNKNSALWAWRISKDKRRLHVAPYFNKDNGIIFPDKYIYFEVGQAGSIRIKRKRKDWTVEVTNNHTNETVSQTAKIQRPWIIKIVGAYFGGRLPAPQEMCMFSHFKL